MDTGTTGAIIGSALGIMGGLAGTYFSIRNTKSREEKSFVIKCSFVVWISVIAFLWGILALPKPYNHFLWLPYAILMPLGIRWMNRKQKAIQGHNQEAGQGGAGNA